MSDPTRLSVVNPRTPNKRTLQTKKVDYDTNSITRSHSNPELTNKDTGASYKSETSRQLLIQHKSFEPQPSHNCHKYEEITGGVMSGKVEVYGSTLDDHQILEVGEVSEAEFTGLNELVQEVTPTHVKNEGEEVNFIPEEEEDIKEMCEAMEDLSNYRQVRKLTDVSQPFDTNLICPICQKLFRIGEIQKYRRHVHECKR